MCLLSTNVHTYSPYEYYFYIPFSTKSINYICFLFSRLSCIFLGCLRIRYIRTCYISSIDIGNFRTMYWTGTSRFGFLSIRSHAGNHIAIREKWGEYGESIVSIYLLYTSVTSADSSFYEIEGESGWLQILTNDICADLFSYGKRLGSRGGNHHT